jgi:hypothetical protein
MIFEQCDYGVAGMRVPVVLAVLIGTFILACSTVTPTPAEPTPSIDATAVVEPTLDIDATVEARVAQERAVDATVEARLEEERAVLPTATREPTSATVPTATIALVPTKEVIVAATATPIKPNPELPLTIEYETYYIDEYRQCCSYIARITNPTENWYKFLIGKRTTKLGAIESEKPDGYRLVQPYSSIEEYLGGQRWYDQEGIVAREVVLDVSPDSTEWAIYPPDGYTEIEHGELFKLYPPATIRDEPLLENISGTTFESVLALCQSPEHYPGFYDASGSELFNQLTLYHEFSFLNVRPGAKKYPDSYSVLYGWWINVLYESCHWYIK